MKTRSVIVVTAVLSVGLPLAPAAHAGNTFTIAVPDPDVKLKESFTVNGSGAPCANALYTVTFAFTNHDGEMSTIQETGTTSEQNQFSQDVTVPESATPEEPASVSATVDCSSPSPTPSGGAAAQRFGTGATSNTVAINIQVATGVLSTDKASGKAGTVVHVSGTNCLGDDVIVVFGNNTGADDVTVTLLPNDTFSGDYTIPNVPAGSYFFAAACPGTDYEDVAFTVLATPGGTTPSPLPPAVPGNVDFTG